MTEELETLRSSSLGSRTLVGLGLEAASVLLCDCQWLYLSVSSVMSEAPVRGLRLFSNLGIDGCVGSLWRRGLLSSCAVWPLAGAGLLWSTGCEHTGFSSGGAQA